MAATYASSSCGSQHPVGYRCGRSYRAPMQVRPAARPRRSAFAVPSQPGSVAICSASRRQPLQHGQQIRTEPKNLLKRAGFVVKDIPEGHICCGSAGTYNLLQPEIAGQLRARKVANIERTKPDLIATGNIGCMTQIAAGTGIPVVHTVELLDWATGGPVPEALERAGLGERGAEQRLVAAE